MSSSSTPASSSSGSCPRFTATRRDDCSCCRTSTSRPDLLFAETANTIWKKIRRQELTTEEGQQLVADIRQIAVETVPCRALAEDAHALANATGRTVYDSMYVALAVRLNTRSITSDERLEAALKSIPAVADHIQLVQTFERDVEAANDPGTSE